MYAGETEVTSRVWSGRGHIMCVQMRQGPCRMHAGETGPCCVCAGEAGAMCVQVRQGPHHVCAGETGAMSRVCRYSDPPGARGTWRSLEHGALCVHVCPLWPQVGTSAALLLRAEHVALVADAGVGARQILAPCRPAGTRVRTLIYVCRKNQLHQVHQACWRPARKELLPAGQEP